MPKLDVHIHVDTAKKPKAAFHTPICNLGQLISFKLKEWITIPTSDMYFSGDWRFCQRLGVWRLVQVTAWKHLLSCSFAPRQTFPILCLPRSVWPMLGILHNFWPIRGKCHNLKLEREFSLAAWKLLTAICYHASCISVPISKKSTDRGEQIGSKRWVHVKKFMRPRQIDKSEYQRGKSEMFDEMTILLPQDSNYLISLSAKLKLLSLSPNVLASPSPLCPICVTPLLPWPG